MPPKPPKSQEPALDDEEDLEMEDEQDDEDDLDDDIEEDEEDEDEDGSEDEDDDVEPGPHDHHIAIAMIEAAAHITASAVGATDKDYIDRPEKVLAFMRAIYNGLAEF